MQEWVASLINVHSNHPNFVNHTVTNMLLVKVGGDVQKGNKKG